MTEREIIEELKMRIDNFSKETLNLINRKNAENERLQDENKSIRYCYKQAKAYNDTLAESCEKNCKKFNMTTRAEAKKEFAEELEYFILNEDIEVVKPKCKDYESYINGANQFRYQIKNGINKLVKEKTE